MIDIDKCWPFEKKCVDKKDPMYDWILRHELPPNKSFMACFKEGDKITLDSYNLVKDYNTLKDYKERISGWISPDIDLLITNKETGERYGAIGIKGGSPNKELLLVDSLFILPEHQNKGIGRGTLVELKALLKKCQGSNLSFTKMGISLPNEKMKLMACKIGFTPSPLDDSILELNI